MAAKTRQRAEKPEAIRHPRKRAAQPHWRPWWQDRAIVTGLVVLAVLVAVILLKSGSSDPKSSTGLPNTPDYHSLLVNPADPTKLVLGTHIGLYVSEDGGRHWRFDALSGKDAMNLARPSGATIWLAGHNVFKKSSDAGKSWRDVRPAGLPGLDIHGFAVDPRDPKTLYAALARQGLYRSRDAGRSFSLVSTQVGGNVMALAVMPDGRILAGDMQQGLLESRNGGASWKQTLRTQLMGLAVNPRDPQRVLAAGEGIALSTNGGRTWRPVLDLPQGAGPIAWSKSRPTLAYAVGFDHTFYRSTNSGETWQPVGEAG